jgi:hypothetical protein
MRILPLWLAPILVFGASPVLAADSPADVTSKQVKSALEEVEKLTGPTWRRLAYG